MNTTNGVPVVRREESAAEKYAEITTRSFFRGLGWSVARQLVNAVARALR